MRIKTDGILTEKGLPKWQQMSEGRRSEKQRWQEVQGHQVRDPVEGGPQKCGQFISSNRRAGGELKHGCRWAGRYSGNT